MTSVYITVSLKSSQQLEVISRLLCVILVAIARALLKLYRGGGGGGEVSGAPRKVAGPKKNPV